MDIILRDEWGARPPRDITTDTWNDKTEFILHHSGASRSQTIKSIQNYCMDNKGHDDIDYCFIVKDGKIYEGRGWLNRGSHTKYHNKVGIGVCIVGKDGDDTEADRIAVRWLYDEACRRGNKTLKKLGHRTANPGTTDCPGNRLQSWVNAGMPVNTTTKEDDTVFCKFGDKGDKVESMQLAIIRAGGSVGPSGPDGDYGNNTAAGLAKLIGGDGKVYGPKQDDKLKAIAYGKSIPAKVTINVPGYTVEGVVK